MLLYCGQPHTIHTQRLSCERELSTSEIRNVFSDTNFYIILVFIRKLCYNIVITLKGLILLRKAGILLHISSLPSEYGIGTLGKSAFEFVDFLKRAGQTYWQVLPVTPTGYGDSPYQSCSAFAGNPYFIDLDILISDGLICKNDINADCPYNARYTEYERIYNERFKILRTAYSHFIPDASYDEFVEKNSGWLNDYALFMAVKNSFGGKALAEWDDDIRLRKQQAIDEYSDRLSEDIGFYKFMQYEFFKQWYALKEYANENGVQLIGDMPIYVSSDSADFWTQPKYFQTDRNYCPTKVAGCPPDAFSAKGQLWGNPVYNWNVIKRDGYKWWITRIKAAAEMFDMVRIDHFRGFESYYTIPYGREDAVIGEWEKGPGSNLFKAVKKELGDVNIIAEDLGFLTDEVHKMLDECGYPGMKILQFAFDPYGDSDYLPHNYTKNCIAYTGTHDNATILGWYDTARDDERDFANAYMHINSRAEVPEACIRTVMSSVADTVIIPIQDWLGMDNGARMNTPSTAEKNWQFRIEKHLLTDTLADKIADITGIYRRR